ncbi:rRNA methyltransferase 3, mitochondrial [Cylas formicarius]|uniref:rRNA methyltransferase 3, mitochondrial n=1 Tax=Cylas formicarius TaxID=197179 RepID=UPI002958340D|nr:rRNA methyltransferase 3, mitochondrial [Cylas formicarius]
MAKLFPLSLCKAFSVSKQQVRSLPRWAHRRPVKVIAADEYDIKNDAEINIQQQTSSVEKRSTGYSKIQWKHTVKSAKSDDVVKETRRKFKSVKPLTIVSSASSRAKPTGTADMLETIIDGDGNFIYTKMGNNDFRIAKLMAEIKSKREKEKNDLMLLEGKRLITEALLSGCKLEYILFSRVSDVEDLRRYLPKLGAKLYKMPYREMQVWSDLTTNPGIMGVFKIPDSELVVLKNPLPLTVICDNVREPNNLGAILRTCSGVGCENILLTTGCVNIWATKVLRGSSGAHFKLRISRKMTWLKIREQIPANSTIFIADNNTISTQEVGVEKQLKDLIDSVPVVPYFSADFKRASHIVLIIGGETEGISEESYKMASELGGARLNIPLSNGLDSLNTGTALGVLAFEIKRQLTVVNASFKEKMAVNCNA